jgi:hypothetical protein
MSILELFCAVDDFWQHFAPNWHHDVLTSGQRQRFAPVDATVLVALVAYLHTQLGRCSGISFIDSTCACGLPQCPHPPTPRLCRARRSWQDLGWMVLRFQATPGDPRTAPHHQAA